MTSSAPAIQEELPQQQIGSKSGADSAAAEAEQQLSDKSGLAAEASAVDVSSGTHNPAEVSENDNGQVEPATEGGEGGKKPEALVRLESPGPLSDMERKQKRAERFGVGVKFSEEEKRKLRASRFNSSGKTGVAKGGILKDADAEKMNARAARFGTGKPAVAAEEVKKKARAERFSGIDSKAEAEKKKARAERFATDDDALKKKKLRTDTAVATAQG